MCLTYLYLRDFSFRVHLRDSSFHVAHAESRPFIMFDQGDCDTGTDKGP
jgi:hypothetical protein